MTSILVVVHQPDWAQPLLRWADLRQRWEAASVHVLAPPEAAGGGLEVVDGARRISGRGVAAEAERVGADRILVGPVSGSVLADLVFGSAGAAGATVVVVPRQALAGPPGHTGKARITVGFHGSRPASEALRWAVEEAARLGADVGAVLAWSESPYAAAVGCVALDQHVHSLVGPAASNLVAAEVDTAGYTGRVDAMARRGHPCAVLVEQAAGSDLLVVGAGQSIVHRHRVLGPIAVACATRSPVPVVIVGDGATRDRTAIR